MLLGILAQSGSHITITGGLMFSLLALLIAIWLVFTLIIRYHWKNYGTGGVEVFTMNFFYLVGSFIGIALMLGSALLYLSST
jgi:hypothetical protein